MVSEYEYTTLAAVEAFTAIDYSAVDSTAFTAVNIDAKITIAEKMINAHLGVTGAQTVTDGIETATILIAAILLDENMNVLGYHREDEIATKDTLGMNVHQILEHFLKDTGVGVDAIPMSGANNNIW